MLEGMFEKLSSLEEVFVHELKDVYDAEHRIIEALPPMFEKATRPELASALREHLDVTKRQVQRLEEIFELRDREPKRQTCAGMKGILSEAADTAGRVTEPGPVLDAVIIEAAQKVEHYEIAVYGTLFAFANQLGDARSAQLLKETLVEEKKADELLTQIAEERGVNVQAMKGERAAPRPPQKKAQK
jgi:ferritin-like metal-binding protein YciE